MENAASENGFDDIEFVVFEGFGAGDWTRMAMASIQAPSIERLGAFMDARQSDWMAESMSAFPSMRTPVRDWFLLCTTLSSVCLLYTSPSPRDKRQSRMPSSA